MPTTILQFSVTVKEVESTISLIAYDAAERDDSLNTIEYEASRLMESYRVTFVVDQQFNLSMNIHFTPSLNTSCLLLCGLSLAGPILDCYKKNRGNWQGFKDCLSDQGHTLGTTTIACVAACI